MARALGLGGGTGLGSIVYALTVLAKLLDDDSVLADAHAVAALITDDVIAADKQLDVIGGSAGGILGLLRLYRDTQAADALRRAVKCGEHLMAQSRLGPEGRRSWVGQGFGTRPLNGMSHGAAGFAYALASLAKAAGREDFAQAAEECVAFEDSNYDSERHNWPDLRGGEPSWPCQWCHGAAGIGLARAATRQTRRDGCAAGGRYRQRGRRRRAKLARRSRYALLRHARQYRILVRGRRRARPADLRELAAQRLAAVLQTAAASGDFRWNSGKRQFNLGLFRGLAGVGYTALRQVDARCPTSSSGNSAHDSSEQRNIPRPRARRRPALSRRRDGARRHPI